MASQKTISIIGAGISGLVLGRCLKAKGISAVLFEKASAAPRHSYSITLVPSSYQPLLKVLDLDLDTFRRRVAVDKSHAPEGGHVEVAPFRVHRGSLEQLLREGLDVRWEHALTGAESRGNGIHLSFNDTKQNFDTDYLVGADGPHSQVRRSFAPTSQLKVLPFVVFNGSKRIPPKEYEALAKYFDGINEIQALPGSTLLRAYINDSKTKYVSIGYTYSRPPSGLGDPLHRPDRPMPGATDIPPEFYTELGTLQNLEEPFKTIYDPANVENDKVLHWLMRSVMVSADEIEAAVGRQTLFIGDALHCMPILGSNGANLAIKDAVELAECLATRGDLKAFYAERVGSWKQDVLESEERLQNMHNRIPSSL